MPVITPTGKGIVFHTKESTLPKIAKVFPQGSYIIKRTFNKVYVAFLFQTDTIKLLRNLGIDTSQMQPIDWKYFWPKVKMTWEMFPHAKITARKMIEMERGFVLNEARTAKTSSVIAAIDFLQQQGDLGGVLIIAPLSTLKSVWVNEIMGMVPTKTVSMLYHKSKTGAKRKEYCFDELKAKKNFYIINPDGVKVINDTLKAAIKKGIITAVILDESTEFGNAETDKWKALYELVKNLRFFWQLTGTPGGPLTVYGQAKLKDPKSVPSRLHIWKMQTMRQLNEYKWVPRPEAEQMIRNVLTPAVRFRKRDVFKDMPEEMIIKRPVDLSAKQSMMMKILNDDGAMLLNGIEVEPANQAVLVDKIMQISSGTMIIDSDNNETVRLPVDDRVDAVLQLMHESPHKTIIIANYVETCSYISDLLTAKNVTNVVVNGGVKPSLRPEIFEQFMRDDGPSTLIAHPETIQYGVELASADKIIFWGAPRLSPFKYKQTKERLFSSFQKSEQPGIYHMYSTTIERDKFNALEKGEQWETNISDFFNEIVEGTLGDI